MIVQNKHTRVTYPMSREKWNALGKNQALFNVIDGHDSDVAMQKIGNVAKTDPKKNTNKSKPETGNKAEKNTTHKDTKK